MIMRTTQRYRLSVLLAIVGMLVNLVASLVLVWRSRKPVDYHVTVNPAPVLDLSFTNHLTAVQSPFPSLTVTNSPSINPVQPVTNPVCIQVLDYDVFGGSDAPCAWLNGRRVAVGSLLPWGVVNSIFPERIVFNDGSYLENRRYSHGATNK